MSACVYTTYNNKYHTHTQTQKDTFDDTLSLAAETGPAITACRAPVRRPSRRSSAQPATAQTADESTDRPGDKRSQDRPAPPGVERKYKSMKATFTKGKPVGQTTFFFEHKLGAGYSPGSVTTCKIHIIDPGAVYGVKTPCPKCGFGVQTDPTGWTRHLRYPHPTPVCVCV